MISSVESGSESVPTVSYAEPVELIGPSRKTLACCV